MDIRMPTEEFEFEGKTYVLRCNFNVLADAENYFGSFEHLRFNEETKILPISRAYLAFMMNDYAAEMGWERRFTPEQLGRELCPDLRGIKEINDKVVRLVLRAVFVPAAATEGSENP